MSGGSSGLTSAMSEAGGTLTRAAGTGLGTGIGEVGKMAVQAAPQIAKTTLTEGVGEGIKAAGGAAKEGMSDVMKSALITGGLGAGAGLATGLASALMAEDPKQQEGHAALPSGSPGNVKGTAGTQMSFGRSNLPQNKDYALAMLQGRRF